MAPVLAGIWVYFVVCVYIRVLYWRKGGVVTQVVCCPVTAKIEPRFCAGLK